MVRGLVVLDEESSFVCTSFLFFGAQEILPHAEYV